MSIPICVIIFYFYYVKVSVKKFPEPFSEEIFGF